MNRKMSKQTETGIEKVWTINNPSFISAKTRLQSFDHAPQLLQTIKNSLSQCGFFYRGYGTSLECFCCGLKLYTWIVGDCPYKEHGVYAEQCVFFRTLPEHKGCT